MMMKVTKHTQKMSLINKTGLKLTQKHLFGIWEVKFCIENNLNPKYRTYENLSVFMSVFNVLQFFEK